MSKKISRFFQDSQIKAFLIVIIVAAATAIIINLLHDFKKENDRLSNQNLELFTSQVSSALDIYQQFSNFIFDAFINRPENLLTLSEVSGASQEEKDKLRNQLYENLEDEYKLITDYSFRQLQFHLPDGESFIRFLRPDLYGDNLFSTRDSVRLANTELKRFEGFEGGKVVYDYRFVYPLFLDVEHIGSVELTVSMTTMLEFLMEHRESSEVFYIISSSAVDQKVFQENKKLYCDSFVSDNYLFDSQVQNEIQNTAPILSEQELQDLFKILQPELEGKLTGSQSFSLLKNYHNQQYEILFYSIENGKDEGVGYLISIQEEEGYQVILLSLISRIELVLFLTGIIIFSTLNFSSYVFRIREEAEIDHLTGLLNRNKTSQLIETGFEEFRRYQKYCSLVLMDIDDFKKINDHFGHHIGDQVIKETAEALSTQLRKNDLLGRWGGEEFLCFIPFASKEDGYIVGEKLRKEIEAAKLSEEHISITISVGVSEFSTDDKKPDDAIIRADRAMYESKEQGKNKTTISS